MDLRAESSFDCCVARVYYRYCSVGATRCNCGGGLIMGGAGGMFVDLGLWFLGTTDIGRAAYIFVMA